MKISQFRYFILSACFCFVTFLCNAQWSAGLDVRFTPWGGIQENVGTDITVNYKISFGNIYIMPSMGLFYTKFTEKQEVLVLGATKDDEPIFEKAGYNNGVDLSVVFGREFKLGSGKISGFTGPRYAYSFEDHTDIKDDWDKRNKHTLGWRLGLGYTIKKFTITAKADIGLLRMYTHENHDERQKTSFAVGLAYGF